jgi:hypothetical protein
MTSGGEARQLLARYWRGIYASVLLVAEKNTRATVKSGHSYSEVLF